MHRCPYLLLRGERSKRRFFLQHFVRQDLILSLESSCDEMPCMDSHGVVCANVVCNKLISPCPLWRRRARRLLPRKHTEAIVGLSEETMARAGAHLVATRWRRMTWPPLVLPQVRRCALVVGVAFGQATSAWPPTCRLFPFITWKATRWPTCLRRPTWSRHLWPAWSRVAHYAGTRACLGRLRSYPPLTTCCG